MLKAAVIASAANAFEIILSIGQLDTAERFEVGAIGSCPDLGLGLPGLGAPLAQKIVQDQVRRAARAAKVELVVGFEDHLEDIEFGRMPITVRPLGPDEGRMYMEIVNSAIRGLAVSHYSPDAIDGWVVPVTDESVGDLMMNADHEIRLIAELDGRPVGIGALIVERSELRACYVSPQAARRGTGSALVREIERLARENGLTRLELAASLNAEAFYTAQGYDVRERSEVVLRSGHRMAAVWMEKHL